VASAFCNLRPNFLLSWLLVFSISSSNAVETQIDTRTGAGISEHYFTIEMWKSTYVAAVEHVA